MFQFSQTSLTKTAVMFGLCACVAMLADTANAQSGSRGSAAYGSATRGAAPLGSSTRSAVPQGSSTRGVAPQGSATRSPAPVLTSTYQQPAPMPAEQNFAQPGSSSRSVGSSSRPVGSPSCNSGCSSCNHGAAAPCAAPIQVAPAALPPTPACVASPACNSTPVNYHPGSCYRPRRSCGCGR